ncbi:hypothetical protein BGW36DRAFT_161605 [Talaromyces proteolyticus]|uniref:Uncharacterized protein n=1 Tax=Talaromyces proteolyticus TaxID=1131652 RepID=A0AAD4Q0C7_9EURO|nr:uncharacterized protein BGW36DRAFT_161605 [Talaromyces proteolyticus]KAH8697141.1 hypothetical protein BGW36DRAFT_161605 [Talaromyces proteolyticus]
MAYANKSIRTMHCIGEFLNLDVNSFTTVTEFVALIQAVREGLCQVDSNFAASDSQINFLFLSKLQGHPGWDQWAKVMLQDKRTNLSDPTEGMKFCELANIAIEREQTMAAKRAASQKKGKETSRSSTGIKRRKHLTQEEINSFVVHQMQKTQPPSQKKVGHNKRPSQEEINEFVIRQMRKEQERKTLASSKSNSETRDGTADKYAPIECFFCGRKDHPGEICRSRKLKVTRAEVPRANFTPKKVEFRTETPGGMTAYRTGFALT